MRGRRWRAIRGAGRGSARRAQPFALAHRTLTVVLLAGCAAGTPVELSDAGDALIEPDMLPPICAVDAVEACTVGTCVGERRCTVDGWSACVGSAETCNAADDDCDGRTDEGFELGTPCRIGLGDCAVDGVVACAPDGAASVCTGEPRAPGPERCDGRDGDCDGRIDEGADGGPLSEGCYPGPPATRDVGLCTAGVATCADGALGVCVGAVVPAVETCDGRDEDCDGRVDEGPDGGPLTRSCFEGPEGAADVGACASGAQLCVTGDWGACEGSVLPALELCDGVDDDCDGRVDESEAEGPPCTVGVGPCARSGRVACVDGVQQCNVRPGRPQPEVCDGVDNDCDGEVDPAPVCEVFASCRAARAAGQTRDGVYRLRPGPDLSEYAVYCDQTSDGGGWALVASSRDVPPNDAADRWHADLRRLDPVDAHGGIWAGLAHLDVRFDVRVACRAPAGAGAAPFDVDAVHYATDWYPRWTAGSDAASCFHLPDGDGADPVSFARRDLKSGRWIARGAGWAAGALVAEAACDADDFALDFSDGGLAGFDPADGTDWGSVGGAARCGRPVVGGQWFVFVREASRWRPDQRFRVDSGPRWDDAPVYSCRAACRALAGSEGPLAGFACGQAADHLDRQAVLDGWGDERRFCADGSAPDSFVLPNEGQPYDCGAAQCGYSAWVDDHGCEAENQCWRAQAPAAFVPPAVDSTGVIGAQTAWRVCAADAAGAEFAGGPGANAPDLICQAAGYREAVAHAVECAPDCTPCPLMEGAPPAVLDGGRWRCQR